MENVKKVSVSKAMNLLNSLQTINESCACDRHLQDMDGDFSLGGTTFTNMDDDLTDTSDAETKVNESSKAGKLLRLLNQKSKVSSSSKENISESYNDDDDELDFDIDADDDIVNESTSSLIDEISKLLDKEPITEACGSESLHSTGEEEEDEDEEYEEEEDEEYEEEDDED